MPNTTSFVPAAPTIPGPVAGTRRPRIKFPSSGVVECNGKAADGDAQ